MCGIAGFVDFTKQLDKDALIKMTDALIHRGPDDAGYELWQTDKEVVGFGHRRLSILDLSSLGHQPMSKGQNFHIVYNGEIYNFKEIQEVLITKGYQFVSNSDTEVILHAYKEWGMQMVQKFTGMFAFAFYDTKANTITLCRDRAGVKPLYYYWDDTCLLFASELKAFHSNPKFKKEINTEAVKLFLTYGYVPAPACIFSNTYKLKPGHFLQINLSNKKIEEAKYWDVNDYYSKPTLKISEEDALAETDKLITKACAYRMVADVPVGVFLSGGYDSSLVTAVLQNNSAKKIKTFTIGFNDQKFNEAIHAKKVADHLGTDHNEYYCTTQQAKEIIPTLPHFYDEPFGDSSAIPTILVSKFAREQVTVALSADAGDEIFGGYARYLGVLSMVNKISKVPNVLGGLAAVAIKNMPPSLLAKLSGLNDTSNENINKVAGYFKNHASAVEIMNEANFSSPIDRINKFLTNTSQNEIDYFNIAKWKDDTDSLKGMLAVDYVSYMANDILTKVDRATMSVSLEGREPLLDQSIVEWVATLPSNLKIKGNTSKYLLKQLTHKYIPASIMERPKMGFGIPVQDWFRQDLKYLFDTYLNDDALNWHGYFNKTEINNALKEYYAGANEKFVLLWYILMFQMWFQKWGK